MNRIKDDFKFDPPKGYIISRVYNELIIQEERRLNWAATLNRETGVVSWSDNDDHHDVAAGFQKAAIDYMLEAARKAPVDEAKFSLRPDGVVSWKGVIDGTCVVEDGDFTSSTGIEEDISVPEDAAWTALCAEQVRTWVQAPQSHHTRFNCEVDLDQELVVHPTESGEGLLFEISVPFEETAQIKLTTDRALTFAKNVIAIALKQRKIVKLED